VLSIDVVWNGGNGYIGSEVVIEVDSSGINVLSGGNEVERYGG
jgi:UDP-glucose 4-epimerase